MSARTRRQKAALAVSGEESEGTNGTVETPSKRTRSKQRSKAAKDDEPKENIFLFYPNIIGMCLRFYSFDCNFVRFLFTDSSALRILPHRACHRVPLLHAPPPSYMFAPLHRLLSAGWCGWSRCA